jgi:hypothetical protein
MHRRIRFVSGLLSLAATGCSSAPPSPGAPESPDASPRGADEVPSRAPGVATRHDAAPIVTRSEERSPAPRTHALPLTLTIDERATAITPRLPQRGGRAAAPLRLLRARLTRDAAAVRGEERTEPRGVDLEQSWHFAERPTGDGDLVVRVAATGERYVGATAGGLHFRDDVSGVGVRYGHGRFVDRDGVGTDVPARWLDGAIELRVPASTLAQARWPAVLDPTISAESAVDKPVAGPTPFGASGAAVAWGGTEALVVWQESPSAPGASDLVGARVANDGTLLDPIGIRVASPGANDASIAFDGTQFWVVYSVYDATARTDEVRAVRLKPDGTVVDKAPLVLAAAQSGAYGPVAAFGAGELLVAWSGSPTTTEEDIYAVRVQPNGTVLDATPFPIVTPTGNQGAPSVAFDGTQFVVAWYDFRAASGHSAIYAARVKPDRTVLDGPLATGGILIANDPAGQDQPSVAATTTGTFIAFRRGYNTNEGDVYGVRLRTDGTLADATPIAIATSAKVESEPSVAMIGATAYVRITTSVDGYTNHDLALVRVNTATGAVVDASAVALSTAPSDQRGGGLVTDGTRLFTAWGDDRFGGDMVYGARVAGDLSLLDGPAASGGFLVSTSWNTESMPAIASDGTGAFAAWVDGRTGEAAVYGARLSTTGTPVDTTARALLTGARDYTAPAIAQGGGKYLVTTTTSASLAASGDVSAAIVSAADGSVVRLTIAGTTAEEQEPAVDFDGADFFVVWRRGQTILGARVKPDGMFASAKDAAGIPLATTATSKFDPALAFDGTRHLVVWEEPNGGASPSLGVRVALDGTPLDATPLAITSKNGSSSAVSAGGGVFLVAGIATTSTGLSSLDAVRLDGTGARLDAGKLTHLADVPAYQRPALAWDGAAFDVAWLETRSSTTHSDVFGTRVRPDGTNTITLGVALSTEATDEGHPAIASLGAGKLMLAYERVDPSLGIAPSRVKVRTVSFGADRGQTCTSASACESGLCVDGRCCDRACDGTCEACDLAGQEGTCALVTGKPRGTRSCGAGDPTCGPSCDGKAAKSCVAFVAAGTPCRAASCQVATTTRAATCDGVGACGKLETASCAGYACDASGTTCRTACALPGECADGFDCVDTKCVARTSTCSADGASVVETNGKSTSCAPYVCQAGGCLGKCNLTTDCAAGLVCGATGACEQPPADTSSSGGCAVHAPHESSGAGLVCALAGALAAATARRRRARG